MIIASGNDRTPYLVYSVPCGRGVIGCGADGKGRRGWAVANIGTNALESVKDARGVTFVDMDEDVSDSSLNYAHSVLMIRVQGTLDILVQRTGSQDGNKILFVQNNFYYDAFFLKAIGAFICKVNTFPS